MSPTPPSQLYTCSFSFFFASSSLPKSPQQPSSTLNYTFCKSTSFSNSYVLILCIMLAPHIVPKHGISTASNLFLVALYNAQVCLSQQACMTLVGLAFLFFFNYFCIDVSVNLYLYMNLYIYLYIYIYISCMQKCWYFSTLVYSPFCCHR